MEKAFDDIDGNVEIVVLPTLYPQGSEKHQIYACTKRLVPPGALPISVGCVVENISTVAAIADAVEKGKPLIERVTTVSGDGIVRSYVVLSLDETGHVVAGEIFDWYPSTADLMIIYLAVKRDERRKNVGSMMLKVGTADVIALIEQRYRKHVRMVYFETEDPSKVQPSGSFVIPLDDRIAFFKANDARVLLHDYFQPPLSKEKDWAWNLMLCVLPVFRRGEEGKMDSTPLTLPSKAEAMEFLTAFYRSLDGSDLTDTGKTHLKQMERALSSAPAGPGQPM